MRRQTSISDQLYAHLFKRPSTNDPPTFAVHLSRNIVPEVRIEVATFYGDLNSVEARYPGLDYCHPPHRMRLSRFKHHRRLFDAFDALGLTDGEVRDFCCWEGTRWARERYEMDQGTKVYDTTGDEIGPFVDRRELRAADAPMRWTDISRRTEISVIVEEAALTALPEVAEAEDEEAPHEDEVVFIDEEKDGEGEANRHDTPQPDFEYHPTTAITPTVDEHARIDMEQRILDARRLGLGLSPEMEQFLKDEGERGNHILAAATPSRTARAAA